MAAYPTALVKHILRTSALGLTAWNSGKIHSPVILHATSPEPATQRQFCQGIFQGEYENILGTSMELRVNTATPSEAQECEWRVLGEIERLRGILSTYDPASEIRQVMAGGPVVSAELADLLGTYQQWMERTAEAIRVNMGGVNNLWKLAAATGRAPTQAELQAAAAEARAYNVDALGKSFIIDRDNLRRRDS
jgi:thiamine biosynthesis lipoprotein ApbE